MDFPFPRTDSSYRLSDRYTESGVTVEHGDAELDFRNLPIKVSGHDGLAEQFDAVHLALDAASAVISAPSSPQGTAQVSRCTHRFVSGDSSCALGFPRLGILAGRDDGMGATRGNRIMAFARVVASVGSDRPDVLIQCDLVQQLREYGRIPNVAGRHLDRPNFQRFVVDPDVYLAPDAPFGVAMLSGIPLAFAL